MVCKEDVLSWFKDLESYKRIDVMYELLNMCVPFEIRFFGTCIEEIGKHSFQELRGPAILANDIEKLSKDPSLSQGLLDENTRHRVLLYISLLSARNCTCANWFYKTLFRTDGLEDSIVKGNCKDEVVQSELMLLFTMNLHHPAFTFDQKQYFGRILSLLIEHKDKESRVPPKPHVFYTHPPGLLYPMQKTVPDVPVKTALPMSLGDTVMHHAHPPGLPIPAVPPPPLDLLTTSLWNRPGFAGTICGAPEVAPFPPPPISPLVSQAGSPVSSRSTSPHRTMNIRAPPVLPALEPLVLPAQLPPMETLSHSSLPLFNSDIKLPDEELNHIQEEKPWASPVVLPIDPKPINGIRFAPYTKVPQSFLIDQMQALNLDGENSLHHSSSSSDSSLNHSPPDTPTVPPHGPGRGRDNKARVNGIPVFMNPPGPPTAAPLCETTPPPPPLPTFTNCSVPYSNFPAQVPVPNRSVFQYAQTYRTPFTAPTPFPYQPTDSVYSTYTVPYVSYMYSSPQGVPFPPRNPYCYNCGASGHLGSDCNGQTIDDITQKKMYALEYTSPLPDADK